MRRVEDDDGGCDDTSVEPGVWRYAMATRVRVVIDADDYFELIQRALVNARQRALLISWDFDTRIHLTHGRRWWQKPWKRQFPARLGSFIVWLTRRRRKLEFRILNWSFGVVKFAHRGTMMLDLLRWAFHPRIDVKFDSAHPVGCSHHHKIAVIDDALAICGGIDVADRRWDTREHREHDPRRHRPGGPLYGPWHDITMMLEGPVAGALDELGRDRWRRAGGKPLTPPDPSTESAWPEGLEAHFENVEVGIARTRAAWRGDPGVHEVEDLFLAQIARAKRFIYAENQYFASRAIAEAISRRLAEPDPPEILIVHPVTANGWIESTAMDPARARLLRAIEEIDHKRRFHLYTPYNGEASIYVHAKLLIVDDELLRIGSANFNNRSMRLDSECDVFIDCARPANGHCGPQIRALRYSLLAEHCGTTEQEMERLLDEAGSMAAMVERLDPNRPKRLVRFQADDPTPLGAALADGEAFDPEDPAKMFRILPAKRGLFRRGSLLARAMHRLDRRKRRK